MLFKKQRPWGGLDELFSGLCMPMHTCAHTSGFNLDFTSSYLWRWAIWLLCTPFISTSVSGTVWTSVLFVLLCQNSTSSGRSSPAALSAEAAKHQGDWGEEAWGTLCYTTERSDTGNKISLLKSIDGWGGIQVLVFQVSSAHGFGQFTMQANKHLLHTYPTSLSSPLPPSLPSWDS